MFSDILTCDIAYAHRSIGVLCAIPEGVDYPVFEDNYLKFMGGQDFDIAAADGFEFWLHRFGFHYERHRDRAISKIDPLAVRLIELLWGYSPDGGDYGIDCSVPILLPTVDGVRFLGNPAATNQFVLRLTTWLRSEGLEFTQSTPGPSVQVGNVVRCRIAREWLRRLETPVWSTPQVA